MIMNVLVRFKRILTLITVLVMSGVLVLYHCGFLAHVPLWVFLVCCLVTFGIALYRPVLVFALFVGLVPLEIVNIAPEVIGLSVRPYQMIAVFVFLGGGAALFFRPDIRRTYTWNIFDTLMSVFLCGGIVSAWCNSGAESVWMHTFIFLSFGLVYAVVRFFVRDSHDVIALFPILVSSGVVISLYAIVQNVFFALERSHNEIMPGRPNATFAEPDWLGIYGVFLIATCLAYLYYGTTHKHIWKFFDCALYVSTLVIFVALILTVARSAWIGAMGVCCMYVVVLLVRKKYYMCMRHAVWIVSVVFCAGAVIFLFHLTTFELGSRVQSAGTGRQEITVSCLSDTAQAQLAHVGHVTDVTELDQYDCRHINLEDIAQEKEAGHFVFTITRDDPNVSARADVYAKIFPAIASRPIVGYGWGQSDDILGADAAGTPLNASNIFLEIFLATGGVGASVFALLCVLIFFYSYRFLHTSHEAAKNSAALFVLSGAVAILLPNMFNAGLLLGFVWVYFGMSAALRE